MYTTNMSKLFSFGALNKQNNKYESPFFADKKNKYKCPECDKDVMFKNGKIKIPHFAHYSSLKILANFTIASMRVKYIKMLNIY
jgi:hypothetical protein